MSDDGGPAITTAQSPFDDVEADIVLHTSDHVDFRVFRRILALSSPFFQTMSTLPRPSDSSAHASSGGLNGNGNKHTDEMAHPPSVDVPEDSQTLDTLLRFLYPNTHVQWFDDLVHARNVAIAASKYTMSAALDKIADIVQTQYVASHPLEVYFIAWRMGWEDVAKEAARCWLDPELVMKKMGGDRDALVRDILDYPDAGIAYHRLEAYRYACHQQLEWRIEDTGPLEDILSCAEGRDGGKGQQVYKGISNRCLKYWIARYKAKVRQAVLEHARKETLDQYLAPYLTCKRCDVNLATSIATLHLEAASKLEKVLSEIELRFGS